MDDSIEALSFLYSVFIPKRNVILTVRLTQAISRFIVFYRKEVSSGTQWQLSTLNISNSPHFNRWKTDEILRSAKYRNKQLNKYLCYQGYTAWV